MQYRTLSIRRGAVLASWRAGPKDPALELFIYTDFFIHGVRVDMNETAQKPLWPPNRQLTQALPAFISSLYQIRRQGSPTEPQTLTRSSFKAWGNCGFTIFLQASWQHVAGPEAWLHVYDLNGTKASDKIYQNCLKES